MRTHATSKKEVQRAWHLIDADGQILGKVATKIASILRGKEKVHFVPYLDTGDFVVVINASKIAVSGTKEKNKIYYRHTGYPGGLREETLEELRAKKPEEIIKRAVKGMLPKNRLGKEMFKKLYVYAGDKHPFKDKEFTQTVIR